MRRIVITADDFGHSLAVNEAIERAARDGVLSAASLMVGAPAAADAVTRARRLPRLKVGLHLTLVQGRPVLPPNEVPLLIGSDDRFLDSLPGAALRWFFLPAARRQLAAEVAAQFAAFRATGLELDHVDVHNHMQFHASVLSEILSNLVATPDVPVRLPREPLRRAGWAGALLAPWAALMRWRVRRAGLRCNDWLLGVRDSGQVDEARLLDYLDDLPPGAVEIHLHPATARTPELAAAMPGYANERELAALLSPRVAARLRERGIVPCGFRELVATPA